MAHRGGADLFPENTMAAYEGAAALGCRAVEAGDLQLTADGVLVAMHDATVDRTTNGRGNVSDYTAAGIGRLVVDASVWFGGHWADQPIPTFAEVLDRLGGSVVLVPESKSPGADTVLAIVDAVVARGLQASVIVQSFRLADVEVIAAAGIAPLYLMGTGAEATPAAVAAAGARFVGLNKDAPGFAAVVAGLRATGLRVLAWTVDTQCAYDAVMAAGCDGIVTNEPLYAARDYAAYRTTRAPWPDGGTFGSGMLAWPGVGPLVGRSGVPGFRGSFIGGPGGWRWTLDRTPYLAGPLCPVAAAGGSYTVTVQLVYDEPAADPTRWGGLYLGVETDDCVDDADPATGYLVALGWNGDLGVWTRPSEGAGMVPLGVTATSPIVRPVLSAALTAGREVTELPVRPLPGAMVAGHQLVLPTGQVATLSAVARAEATALAIEPLVASAAVETGTALLQQVTLVIGKTPDGLTVTRADDGVSASYADRTWAGGYLFLRNCRDAVAAISCSSLSVSEPRRRPVSRNVVIHDHMGDPAGYAIGYDDERKFVVTRVTDGREIGRYDTRVEAIAAAEADRTAGA